MGEYPGSLGLRRRRRHRTRYKIAARTSATVKDTAATAMLATVVEEGEDAAATAVEGKEGGDRAGMRVEVDKADGMEKEEKEDEGCEEREACTDDLRAEVDVETVRGLEDGPAPVRDGLAVDETRGVDGRAALDVEGPVDAFSSAAPVR